MTRLLKYILACFLCWNFLHGKSIDILVKWDLKEVYNQDWSIAHQAGYNIRVFKLGSGNKRAKIKKYLNKYYSNNTEKIIVMEDFIPRNILASIPKSKIILFMWEPIGKTEDCNYYSYVYTFNDDLVGTKNYRKFVYPQLLIPCLPNPLSFEKKKLCAAVISHWLPERENIVNFFKETHPGSFDLYGRCGPFNGSIIYKGQIPGHHSASPKLDTLRNYKFVLAFENSACPNYGITSGYWARGYITEKIFDVFAAGAVPIYLGPENIEHYIPKNCFIAYKDFRTPEELYHYLSQMSEEVYEQYLQNIRDYLQHDRARIFSQTAFEQTILEAAKS